MTEEVPITGELIKKNKGGRPKGSKDSYKRIRKGSDLRNIKKGDPRYPEKIREQFYKRFVDSGNMALVMDKIMAAALDDDHKHQAAAWKELMDRGVPKSVFEDVKKEDRPIVHINITGSDSVEIEGES